MPMEMEMEMEPEPQLKPNPEHDRVMAALSSCSRGRSLL